MSALSVPPPTLPGEPVFPAICFLCPGVEQHRRAELCAILAQFGLVVVDSSPAVGEPLLLVAATDRTALIGELQSLRKAHPETTLLGWFPEKGGDVDLLRQAQDAGADEVLMGLPDRGVFLTRVLAAKDVAERRQRERRAECFRKVMGQTLTLFSTPPAKRALLEDELPEGIPQLIGDSESEDASLVMRQVLGLSCQALHFDHAAVVVHIEDLDALAVVTSSASQASLLAPRVRAVDFPLLRSALRKLEPSLLGDPSETERLCQLAAVSKSAYALCQPLPYMPPHPTQRTEDPLGLVFFLSKAQGVMEDEAGLSFLRFLAQISSLGLRGRDLVESVREKTRRVHINIFEAERRREALLSYRTFFESSADGVMVLDQTGRVLYLNRIAEQMTGYAAAGLADHPIVNFMPEPQPDGLLEVVRQVVRRVTLMPFDMQLTTTSGETLVLSVSTSSVLAEHGLAVLSFRDVTEQRALEFQLRNTRDFLERLIDSAVDAIVACDISGNVLLFNQGAARLFGYPPEEVVGKINVADLYPVGEARRIMSQLRSGEFGGVGKLQQSRRVVLGKNRERIPVTLSAALVYEDGKEVATIGVLSDLRERLHIEERLQKAQERLLLSEKHAIVAELAGTAAHELNQPLTSVMGCAALLRRRLGLFSQGREEEDGAQEGLLELVDIVVREAERMAEIVRKLGRVTRYETKEYVGESRILDLDRSAPDSRGTEGR